MRSVNTSWSLLLTVVGYGKYLRDAEYTAKKRVLKSKIHICTIRAANSTNYCQPCESLHALIPMPTKGKVVQYLNIHGEHAEDIFGSLMPVFTDSDESYVFSETDV